jgi:uncharacterized protein involved in exopolysaccharide biosynthesis
MQLLRPLDVVPASKLQDAARAEALAAGYLHELSTQNQRVGELEQTVERLTGQLEVANSRVVSLEATNRQLTKAKETERREALLRFASGEDPPTTKVKPKTKAAA